MTKRSVKITHKPASLYFTYKDTEKFFKSRMEIADNP